MKGLLKHLSPLAPDDSGACSVLYELGGIVVICDAGGCTGNVCGFDEPRWHIKPSALFSAGLRDMDAILGRDEKLIEKLEKICTQIPAEFTAIIGTPVPAVIATDFKALSRMAQKRTGLPCITLETDGTKLYDSGEELAYLKLFENFAEDGCAVKHGKIGIIGATPLGTGAVFASQITRDMKSAEYVCFGLDSAIDDIRRAGECERLLVISPSGIRAAEYLNKRFGAPYEVGFPCLPRDVKAKAASLHGKRVLIINQQFAANALREFMPDCQADCATWFMFDKRYSREGDIKIKDESALNEKITSGNYDVIFADADLKRAVRNFDGEFVDFPHYAVSARTLREE